MRRLFLSYGVACALAASWFAGAAIAAESGALAAPEYRLRIDQASPYRLAARGAYAPAPAPAPAASSGPSPAALLADRPYAELIDAAARKTALDPALVHAVIAIESGYNPAARSPKGAIGLMQVLPETASRHGVPDPGVSPAANLRAGTRYLSALMEMFGGRLDLALAAYNAGENAVLRHGQRIPPYPETQLYVPAVLAKYREWQGTADPTVSIALPSHLVYLPGTRLNTLTTGEGSR